MRIALIANEYPPEPHGGIGSFTSVYARALASKGHDVTVVGIAPVPSVRHEADVQIVRVRQSRVRLAGGLLSRRAIEQWVARNRFDIVEAPEFQGMLPFGAARTPAVIRLHLAATTIARMIGGGENATLRWAERSTLSRTANWIAVSGYAAALTERTFNLRAARMRVIPCPIEMSAIAGSNGGRPPVVLFAGRVSERKGAIRLARAAGEFLRECSASKLVFVGDEEILAGRPIRERILEIVGPDLASRVEFKGRLPARALRTEMRNAAVFAFPSSLETLGLVVVEAMAEACAVVVPQGPPFDEFVRDGDTGMCVPLQDSRGWAKTIVSLIRDPERSVRLGTSARKHVEQSFSVSRCVAESVAFYAEAIELEARRKQDRRTGKAGTT